MPNNKIAPLTILPLKQGNIEIGILPELGGSIAFAKFNNIDFMRPWTGELTPRRTCCYPLVPFSNRIANGQFSFNHQQYQLAKNFGDHPHTIHGVGWQSCWQVLEHTMTSVILAYEHSPCLSKKQAWPFSFLCTQKFEITDNSLNVSMYIQNTDQLPMPVGFGWHPFFPRHNGVELQFCANKIVINDEGMLPQKITSLPKKWNFSQLKRIMNPLLDNCYIDWNKQAFIHWPKQKLALSLTASEELSHLVVMTPSAPLNHFFAVEPVSHINNAINSTEPLKQGIKVLNRGESVMGSMCLTLNTTD